jgi:hypothetical protein
MGVRFSVAPETSAFPTAVGTGSCTGIVLLKTPEQFWFSAWNDTDSVQNGIPRSLEEGSVCELTPCKWSLSCSWAADSKAVVCWVLI